MSDEQILQLFKKVAELDSYIKSQQSSTTIPLALDQALQGRGFIKNTSLSSLFSTVSPLLGTKTYYVSDSSGGTVNRKLTFKNGILISES